MICEPLVAAVPLAYCVAVHVAAQDWHSDYPPAAVDLVVDCVAVADFDFVIDFVVAGPAGKKIADEMTVAADYDAHQLLVALTSVAELDYYAAGKTVAMNVDTLYLLRAVLAAHFLQLYLLRFYYR